MNEFFKFVFEIKKQNLSTNTYISHETFIAFPFYCVIHPSEKT